MFNMGKLVGVAVVVLVMSGCSAAVTSNDAEKAAAPEVVASAEAVAPEVEAAPVAIEPTAAPADPTANFNGFGSQREWYLQSLEGALSGAAPSDDLLVGAGALACEQLIADVSREDVRVVEGGTPQDDLNIAEAAAQVYCPGY